MRKIISVNNNWFYKAEFKEETEDNGLAGYEAVNLPHTNVELPYNYFDEKKYQFVSCYKYPLNIDKKYRGKIIYMHFEGVMTYARVYLNDKFLGEHKGGYTPFDVRIDEALDFGAENNILKVIVDSREIEEIPPFGGQIDYLTYGGIYREVSLGIYDDIFIKRIKIEPENVLSNEKNIKLDVYLENIKAKNCICEFQIVIKQRLGKEIYNQTFKKEIEKKKDLYEFELRNLKDIKLWDVDEPNLYEIEITARFNEAYDRYSETFGFRKAEFTQEGFYLNGRKLKLRGLNRHQSYPYVGYAMPKRMQQKDADILKNELGLNIVRTSHYPQSKYFLNRCDEIGLLVFEEIPGWQHIGNEEWKNIAKQNVQEMIQRDWNHPSIILWGVRINESMDDDAFYMDTNKIAHGLDASRQTGGVRCIEKSRLLEDVYTFNDFIHDGVQKPLRTQSEVTGLSYKVPYMVTECNGHMYPTKRFDCEERQIEHALRHLRVHDSCCLDDNNSGVIGWCAFDYNTHKDFGSGDRICYHGVMDMFRIPKFAAYVYKSQISPEIEPVLEPATFWARGERSVGGVIPLTIFTNCDYIEFQYGDLKSKKKIYPSREKYKGIAHPPVVIDDTMVKPEEAGEWGMEWENAVIKGYFKDKVVIEKRLCGSPVPSKLYASADDHVLDSSEKDATRVVIKVLDQYNNILPFIDEIIKIEVSGPGKLQGPDELVVKGGATAFYIETVNEKGEIEISINTKSFKKETIKIRVE